MNTEKRGHTSGWLKWIGRHWCVKCGLVRLNNERSRVAWNAHCRWWD